MYKEEEEEEEPVLPPEEAQHGSLSTKVYVEYFSAGGILATMGVIFLFILGEVSDICMYLLCLSNC